MTPAVRAVEAAGVPFTLHRYEHDPQADSFGLEAAAKLGVAPERVFKTLIAQVDGKKLVMAVLPVSARLDLKRLAAVVGGKKADMAEVAAAERATGYVVGGISPLGGRKKLPTFLDASARMQETLLVSAGQRGLQLELSTVDFMQLTTATTAELSVQQDGEMELQESMPMRVTLIQGGGMGLDQVPAVQRILEAVGIAIEWDEHLAGWASMERGDAPLPEALLKSVRETGLALKTKLLPTPSDLAKTKGRAGNFNVQLRQELGLFATVRPLKNLPGLPARFQGVDMLVIRELTEDLYAAIEHEIVPGVVQSLKIVTEAASRRFFRFAFDWARAAGRKTITCVHKANILKLADGLFLEAFRSTARDFPDMQAKEIIVDNCCMQMVSRPQQFDVLAMGNLYGDLVSDLGAGVVGGVSATHGINVGAGIHVYESFHGGSRETLGVDHANPLPLLLPALDLLEALGHGATAQRLLSAVGRVLTERRVLTHDLGGSASTTEMTAAILRALD